jgi:hypothetical protein
VTQLKKKACIATSYDENFKNIGDLTTLTMRRYAKRHGFDFIADTPGQFDRPPAWHRIQLIPSIFDRGYDYVMWIDTDARFLRFDENILNLVSSDKHLYLVEHKYPPPQKTRVPNTGVVLMQNCTWCREFLESVWDMTQYLNHPWRENAAAIKKFGYNSLLDEGPHSPDQSVLQYVQFLPEEWNFVPTLNDLKEPIIKHYAEHPNSVREEKIPMDVAGACLRNGDGIGALKATRAMIGAHFSRKSNR